MNCGRATPLVEAYADGELESLRRQAIDKHLRVCVGCAAMRDDVLALRARLHAEVPYFKASPELRARVFVAVGAMRVAAPPRLRPAPKRWSWLTGGALAGCTATLLAWMLAATVLDWRANENLADQAVTAHVRAVLDHDLIQVASSDRHTVKPWLSARLDYSPPVRDLAGEGFTLVGGRLDMLNERSVATLVYRHRLHTIDVFVCPESAQMSSPKPRTVRGFNIAHATGSGMHWLAVSDVDASVLTDFVQRIARPDETQ